MKMIEQTTFESLIKVLDAKTNICVWDKNNSLEVPIIDCKVYNLYDTGIKYSMYWIDDVGIDFSGVRVIISKKF